MLPVQCAPHQTGSTPAPQPPHDPNDFRYTRATSREACLDGSRLEGRGFEVVDSYEKFEAAKAEGSGGFFFRAD
jgi:hypothetical protein